MGVLRNVTSGIVIATNVRYARSWWERMAGFIPYGSLTPNDGLWFANCWAIHTLGMRAAIDVLFLDERDCVLHADPQVRTGRAMVAFVHARSVIELGCGALRGSSVMLGDHLCLEQT